MNLLHRRWIRRSLWALLSVAALIVLLRVYVDWSGARQWRAVRAMLAREGQPLDLRAAAYEPIPDAENFCAIPALKDLARATIGGDENGEPEKKRARLLAASLPLHGKAGAPPPLHGVAVGQRTDLKRWAAWFQENGSTAKSGDAARDVLSALSKDDAMFEELAGGLDRPEAQWTPAWKTRVFPLNLFEVTLPHYNCAQQMNRSLALRSIAAARAGDAPQACQSAQIIARLSKACLEEPNLLGLLVAASGTANLANITWELSDAQAGTAEDFGRLESALAGMDFRNGAWRAFSGELIGVASTFQSAKQSADLRRVFVGLDGLDSAAAQKAVAYMVPPGFFDASTAVLADHEFRYFVKPLRDHGWQAALASAHEFDAELEVVKGTILTHPAYILTGMVARVVPSVLVKAIYAQTLVNQAVIACALERYRIEQERYPDSLDLVTPSGGKPLPKDILTGKPMSYRKTVNGKYALWSVSFDGKDHGGQRALDKAHPEGTKVWKENYAGDWVWDFPERSLGGR